MCDNVFGSSLRIQLGGLRDSTSDDVGPLYVLRNVPVVLGALEETLDVVGGVEQLVLVALHQFGVHSPVAAN